VLAIDLPGHGKSDYLQDYSNNVSELLKDAISAACKYFNFTQFAIVGNFMGGFAAVYCYQNQ
jgi:pimeloyl-ACP methyl ester carboxylesterase